MSVLLRIVVWVYLLLWGKLLLPRGVIVVNGIRPCCLIWLINKHSFEVLGIHILWAGHLGVVLLLHHHIWGHLKIRLRIWLKLLLEYLSLRRWRHSNKLLLWSHVRIDHLNLWLRIRSLRQHSGRSISRKHLRLCSLSSIVNRGYFPRHYLLKILRTSVVNNVFQSRLRIR